MELVLDENKLYEYNCNDVLLVNEIDGKIDKERCFTYENDISAEEEIQSKSSRIQSAYEHKGRRKVLAARRLKGRKQLSA